MNATELHGLQNAARPDPDPTLPLKCFHLRPSTLIPGAEVSLATGHPYEARGPRLLVGEAVQCDVQPGAVLPARLRHKRDIPVDVRVERTQLLPLHALTSRQCELLGLTITKNGYQLGSTLPAQATPALAVAAWWDRRYAQHFGDADQNPWVWLVTLSARARLSAGDAAERFTQLLSKREQDLSSKEDTRRLAQQVQADADRARSIRLSTDDALLELLRHHPHLDQHLTAAGLYSGIHTILPVYPRREPPPTPDPLTPSGWYQQLLRDVRDATHQYQRLTGPVREEDVALLTGQLWTLATTWPDTERLYFSERHWLSIPGVEPLDERAVKALDFAELHRRQTALREALITIIEAEVRDVMQQTRS